jgi:hypothetical protein
MYETYRKEGDAMKGPFVLVMVVVLLLSITATVLAHTEDAPQTVTLWAGQHINAGTISVWNNGENLYVKYETNGGWVMTETHLYVGKTDPSQLTSAPGQFPYKAVHDPAVSEYTYIIALAEIDSYQLKKNGKTWLAWDSPGGVAPGDDVYIAAHAVLSGGVDATTTTVISDDTVQVTVGNNLGAAVYAWEPGTVWEDGVDHDFTASGADWIWESYRVVHPVIGDIIVLEKTFQLEGYALSGTLYITCDNGYEAYLNGAFVGSAQVHGDWQNSNLTESYVNRYGWKTVEQWDLTGLLQSGENLLTIIAANERMEDGLDNQDDGTIGSNPGACIFELNAESALGEETGWGEGTNFGNAWGMYFGYEVQ